MQILENIPEDLVKRAIGVLSKKDALSEAMRVFIEQVAANHIEAAQLWEEVEKAAEAQGIQKAANEVFSFDYVTKRFSIVRPQKG